MNCFGALPGGTQQCGACGYNDREHPTPLHQMRPRTILNGKYLLGRVLGEGGFGITYIGKDLNLEVKVAIKEYYPSGFVTREVTATNTVSSYAGDQEVFFQRGRERFVEEARNLAKFRSRPGIVEVSDFFMENGTAYIVMEFIEGQTLKRYLSQMGGRLPAEQVFGTIRPLMESLSEVHRLGIIHRDISPDNIMITDIGTVKLLDFGAAREFTDSNDKSKSIMLKPGYAPEEQYRSRGSQGPWTDVYALCATMYNALTGVVPEEALERLRNDTVRPPSMYGVAIHPAQEAALMKGLAVLQENRFRDTRELYMALYNVPAAPPMPTHMSATMPAPMPMSATMTAPMSHAPMSHAPMPPHMTAPAPTQANKPPGGWIGTHKGLVGIIAAAVAALVIVVVVVAVSSMSRQESPPDTSAPPPVVSPSLVPPTPSLAPPSQPPSPTSATITVAGEDVEIDADEVVLSDKYLTDISELRLLTHVTDLNVSYNHISDISALSGLDTLKYLDLSFNNVGDLSALEGLQNLVFLHLSGNPVTPAQVSALKNALPNCEVMFFGDIPSPTPSATHDTPYKGEATFEVYNNTAVDFQLFIRSDPDAAGQWDTDWLEFPDLIPAGDDDLMGFSDYDEIRYWYIKIETSDDMIYRWEAESYDLIDISSLTFYTLYDYGEGEEYWFDYQ
ncbi:MAG: protein kinase [Oscillospiraceae bacterium]|nr:protein kinase [Oscillospiraceae bacterium]